MNENDRQVEVKPPWIVVEEHDGSMFLTIPGKGVDKQMLKAIAYGAALADDRVVWHWTGNFMAAADAIASVLENNPGMMSIVSGLLEARMAARMRRAQGGEG
jgi:hypothetical protein